MKVVLLQQYGTETILTLKTGNFQRFKASFSKTLKHPTDVQRSERQISEDTS